MKNSVKLAWFVACFCPVFAFAQSSGCDVKRQSIETELAYAQAHGNSSRVLGLQKALSEVKAHCSDASLRRDAEEKVAKAQEKLDERQKDLQEAKDQGKSPQKIADRQRKVDQAHADLEQAMIDASP